LQNSPTEPPEDPRVSNNLRKVLNSHGHGFHYAVLRRFHDLSRTEKTAWAWRYEASEFPVIVGTDTTTIDFIL